MIVVRLLGIVKAQGRNCGPEHIHWKSGFRRAAQEIDNCRIELAFSGEPFAQLLEFLLARQSAIPQQEASLLEIGVVGEFVNIDATIGENSLITVQKEP